MEIRNRVVDMVELPIGQIIDHPDNFRRHSPAQRNVMHELMNSVGLAGAVLVRKVSDDPKQYQLIDGHMRKEVLGEHEATTVPAIVLDVDEREAKLILATYDKVGSLADVDDKDVASLLSESLEGTELSNLLRKLVKEDRHTAEVLKDEFKQASDPIYPLTPELDEGYHAMIIFARSEREWSRLQNVIPLPRVTDRGGVAVAGRVIHVEKFLRRIKKLKMADLPEGIEE